MRKRRNFMCILILLISGVCIIPSHCTKVENFVADIALKSFPDYSLFFIRQSGQVGTSLSNLNVANVIIRQGIVACHIVQLEETPNENSTKSFPFNTSFPVRIGGYNKRSSVCQLVIFSLDSLKPEFLTAVRRLLAPVYQPIVRTDSDPWIWITSDPALLEPLLLSSALPAKTKYKLGISLTPSGDLVIRTVCFFCGNGGTPQILDLPVVNPTEFNYFPDYVSNLNGKLLRISTAAIASLIEIDLSLPIGAVNRGKRGMWVSLFDEFLSIRLNFTCNLSISSGDDDGARGGGTGVQVRDGRWIGVLGDIISGRADIGLLATPTPDRLPYVSFTNAFFYASSVTFTTAHATRLFSPAALLWAFDSMLWICIGIATLTAFLVFKVLTSSMNWIGLVSEASSLSRRGIASKYKWEIRHQILFAVSAYLDQDTVLPRSTSLRCFVALWLFFTLIITTIYRSKMVSMLAFPILEKLPTTFQELTYSDYHVTFLKQGDAWYNTLKATTDPVYVTLLNKMEVMTGIGVDCLERVLYNVGGKKESCIAYDFSTTYIKQRNLSDVDIRHLVTAKDTTYNIFVGLTLEGGSIYKESLERWLRWTRPFHFETIWLERDMYSNVRLPKLAWWKETNQTEKLARSENVESSDLTLKHISGAFYVLVACLVISAAIFGYEVCAIFINCNDEATCK